MVFSKGRLGFFQFNVGCFSFFDYGLHLLGTFLQHGRGIFEGFQFVGGGCDIGLGLFDESVELVLVLLQRVEVAGQFFALFSQFISFLLTVPQLSVELLHEFVDGLLCIGEAAFLFFGQSFFFLQSPAEFSNFGLDRGYFTYERGFRLVELVSLFADSGVKSVAFGSGGSFQVCQDFVLEFEVVSAAAELLFVIST